jgi:hypothetical protein
MIYFSISKNYLAIGAIEGNKDPVPPALSHLVRDITSTIILEVIQDLSLQTWCVLGTMAALHLLAIIHSKDCCVKHCI